MMNTLTSLSLEFIIGLNIPLGIIIIFRERHTASFPWTWLLLLFFIPLLGFFLYLLLWIRCKEWISKLLSPIL